MVVVKVTDVVAGSVVVVMVSIFCIVSISCMGTVFDAHEVKVRSSKPVAIMDEKITVPLFISLLL